MPGVMRFPECYNRSHPTASAVDVALPARLVGVSLSLDGPTAADGEADPTQGRLDDCSDHDPEGNAPDCLCSQLGRLVTFFSREAMGKFPGARSSGLSV